MEETQENLLVSVQDAEVVAKPTKVSRTHKKKTKTKELAESDTKAEVVETVTVGSTPAESTMGAVEKSKETSKSTAVVNSNGDKGNFKRTQNKGNFKTSANKFTQQNTAYPANLQRYRWWIGQLYQWRSISDLNALNTLVEEVFDPSLTPFLLNEWYNKPLSELLNEIPEESQSASLTRQSILREKMRTLGEQKHPLCVEGVISKVPNTDEWSVCYASDNYQLRELSAYLPKVLVKKYGLRAGQTINGQLYVSPVYLQCPCIIKINSVMGKVPEDMRTIAHFKELIPYYPTHRILLETNPCKGWDNNAMRIVDILTPIGFGQRGLIVAPPRTGKTVLLQNIANSIVKNQPQAHLIVLLIDERPEEVTDFKNLLPGIEVISSTFDESPESHVRAAEVVVEKAKRLVEIGQHVIILLDSITRLARAYNTIIPSSGKVLSGGVEANALQGPKAFFGAARNIENGGSLTILATALIDTGSKMDEVIFEEFKGTGNMEIHLDRSLIDKRIFPAINIEKSGTRKEELLYHPDELLKIYSLRRAMKGVIPSTEAMEMLLDRIKKTNNNIEFLMSING